MLSEFKVDRATETDIYGYCVNDSGDAMITIRTISHDHLYYNHDLVDSSRKEKINIAHSTRKKILCQRKRIPHICHIVHM